MGACPCERRRTGPALHLRLKKLSTFKRIVSLARAYGGSLCVRRKLWSDPENPPDWVATEIGISREELGERLYTIKRAAGLKLRDRVTIWSGGDITSAADDDDLLGNVHDED
jgi:hypothetical protein